MKKQLILPFLTLVLFSCGNETLEIPEVSRLDGKELMENKCFSCHNTQGTGNMLAPPMQRVKDHYWDEETTKEEFVSEIVAWCENPTDENSAMPGAKRKFGLMPKQEFDIKEVKAIAEYLFENDIDNSSCSSNDSGCSNCGSSCSHEH